MKRLRQKPHLDGAGGVELALQAGLGLPFAFQSGGQAAAGRLGGAQAGPQHHSRR